MRKRLRRAERIAESLPNASDIGLRVREAEKNVERARKWLKVIQLGNVGEDDRRALFMALEGVSYDIDICASDISLLLSQRMSSSLLRKREQKFVKPKTLRYFVIPRQTRIVLQKFLDECLNAIYGQNFRTRYPSLTPIVTIWPRPEYHYSSFSRTISIPPQDATKMCRFSSLAHEVCHSKIHNIMVALKAEKEPNQELASSLLGADWKDINEEWGRLEERFINLVKRKLDKTYLTLYSNIQDKFIVPRRYLGLQFTEILCDVATTKICGPADIFLLGWISAPYCRDPFSGVRRHLLDLNHPPDVVRLRYELYVLQIGQNNLSDSPRFPEIFRIVDNLIGFDLRSVPKEKWYDHQKLSDYLIGTYTFIVMKLLEKDIVGLVDRILGGSPQFDKDRWERIVRRYEESLSNPMLNSRDLLPYDLANMAWLKVADIFESTIGKGGTYKNFWTLRSKERFFFKRLWNCVVKK